MKKAVAAIVNYNEKILLGKKCDGSKGILSGKWHIPGETLEENESDEEGLIRGIKEEASIEIKVEKYLGSHFTPKHTLVRWYECFPLTKNIQAGSDLDEVKWVDRKKVLEICDDAVTSLWPKEVKEYFLSFC